VTRDDRTCAFSTMCGQLATNCTENVVRNLRTLTFVPDGVQIFTHLKHSTFVVVLQCAPVLCCTCASLLPPLTCSRLQRTHTPPI